MQGVKAVVAAAQFYRLRRLPLRGNIPFGAIWPSASGFKLKKVLEKVAGFCYTLKYNIQLTLL